MCGINSKTELHHRFITLYIFRRNLWNHGNYLWAFRHEIASCVIFDCSGIPKQEWAVVFSKTESLTDFKESLQRGWGMEKEDRKAHKFKPMPLALQHCGDQ